jgi:ABC-type polysaccharide/polyol phosphate transport system ATPase subunit
VSRPALLVEGVTVRFRPYIDRKPTLRKSISRLRAREQANVVALDDVSFQVEKGEAFGILGRNGAGKSTLLRVMAGTLRPNAGRVVVNGKTSTLLQLGVGFNPELSGARNIYLGGLAAGLRKAEVDDIFESVVEWAELGDAIERPLKTYSTGMFSRLAFSISMHLDPDIILLDEVLAVGDESFREKSMDRMRGLLDASGTIVYVSHALSSVAEFCDRALWLDAGRVRDIGPAAEIVATYTKTSRAGTRN